MFSNRGLDKRMNQEARALKKKASKNGKLSGRDAARLTKVVGRAIKYGSDPQNFIEDQYYTQ